MEKTYDMQKTFLLSETQNEEFWEKVLYVEKWHSSGLGGPGALWIITADKLLYQIGFETFPYDENNLAQFNQFFEVERYDKNLSRRIYKIESHGWKYLEHENDIWIRNQYAEEFEKQIEKYSQRENFIFSPQVFAGIIGVEGEIERVLEEKFAQLLIDKRMEAIRREKKRDRITIRSEQFTWMPLYMNNENSMPQVGEYALLFAKRDKQIKAYKFSITYQMPEEKPMLIKAGEIPELFILCVNEYDTVIGPYEYPDVNNSGATNTINFEHTFHNLDMNNYGRFIRAFKTMEEAKSYCVPIATSRYQITLENLYIPQ